MNDTPSFLIKNIPIYGRLVLAPMDGYTDSPFRNISRTFGSAFCVSEFINGIDLTFGHPHLEKKLHFTDQERPFAYQIFDDNPERLIYGAQKLRERNPDFIDINMGCSARNVSNRGAGAGLLKVPQKIAYIFENLVKVMDIPITGKIRLGWDEDSLNYLEISKILQESGASLVTVHARTKKQEYTGSAKWSAIGEIKARSKIPIIGNGDVKNIDEVNRMLSETNCDAVMIGRAAVGNPWIFASSQRDDQSIEERIHVIEDHVRAMVDLYGEKIGIILFRKHLTRYLYGYLRTADMRKEVYSIARKAELLQVITQILQNETQEYA